MSGKRIDARLVLGALPIVFLISAMVTSSISASDDGNFNKPNIILINLDDADTELFETRKSNRYFPKIMRSVARKGLTFTNLHVTTPICGPSRACLYRGQYAHNTGIRVNQPGAPHSHNFNGGFRFYREQGYFENDLGIWMQDAGYRTMMVGKFLHHDFEAYVPPGWDDFYSSLGTAYFGTTRFTNRTNPNGEFEALGTNEYRTHAESADAINLIKHHVAQRENQPFFLNINPLAPHASAESDSRMIEPRYERAWRRELQPDSFAYDEADFSDKRGGFADLMPAPTWVHSYADVHYRERVLSMRSADNMVGEILKTLKRLRIDDQTYIFITSDNGFSLGHHRMIGKGTPTDRASNVPLFVMGPNIPSRKTANHLLGHIDLAPTIVELAQGTVPEFVDGKSFLPLLVDPNSVQETEWRQHLLIENWESIFAQSNLVPMASSSLRMIDSVYTEWANGDRDFYNLKSDPEQLENKYDSLEVDNRLYYELAIRTLKNPNLLAKARFSAPATRGERIPPDSTLSGYAENGCGVAHVSIAIQDFSSGHFWNGSQWQDSFASLNASVENQEGQITRWSFPLPQFDDENFPGGELGAWVWAYDEHYRHDEPSMATFSFTLQPK